MSRAVAFAVGTVLSLIALVAWSFAADSVVSSRRIGLFLLAVAALAGALRRHPWIALAVAGIMAMAMHGGHMETLDGWAWVILLCLSTSAVFGLADWPGLRWILASLPFWALGDAAGWTLPAALGFTLLGLAISGVRPTLVGRRLRRSLGEPLPHLASGPVGPVSPQVFFGGQPSRAMQRIAVVLSLLAAVFLVLALSGQGPVELGALAIAAVIIAITFAFGNWFAHRVRLRVDDAGIHGRTMFREHSVRWNEIVGLRLRYVYLFGFTVRLVYYVVQSQRHEIAFPSSMRGANDLKAAIEGATALEWPTPEIQPNM